MAGSERSVPDPAMAGGGRRVAGDKRDQAVGAKRAAGGKRADQAWAHRVKGRATSRKSYKDVGGESWAWWGWWLGKQIAPDGEPRDGVRSAAEEMAREIAERVPLGAEQLAVLDLICYRGLLRAIPKLRRLGVVGRDEFCRLLGTKTGRPQAHAVLGWLVGLGLVRAADHSRMGYEIPVAVVEVCLRLKAVRGKNWWKPLDKRRGGA